MKRAIIIGFLLVISAAANAQVFFGIGLSKYRSFYRSEEYVVNIGHSHDFYYGHDKYYVSFEHYIINDRPVKSGSFSSVFGYQYKRFTYGFAFDYNQLQWRNGSHNLKESTISICPLFRYDLIQFDSGVVCIRHWKVNNSIQKDRYTPTVHTNEKEELIEIDKVYFLHDYG